MRTVLFATIVTASIIGTSAFAQGQPPATYNPGTQPATQVQATAPQPAPVPAVDHAAKAKQHFASWSDLKISCYTRISGLTRGQHWRVNPNKDDDIQIHNSVWSMPKPITDAVAACKALQPQ